MITRQGKNTVRPVRVTPNAGELVRFFVLVHAHVHAHLCNLSRVSMKYFPDFSCNIYLQLSFVLPMNHIVSHFIYVSILLLQNMLNIFATSKEKCIFLPFNNKSRTATRRSLVPLTVVS